MNTNLFSIYQYFKESLYIYAWDIITYNKTLDKPWLTCHCHLISPCVPKIIVTCGGDSVIIFSLKKPAVQNLTSILELGGRQQDAYVREYNNCACVAFECARMLMLSC